MSDRYTLYGRQGAGSVAPQIVLETLGIPYDMVWVTKGQAELPDYLKINPTGKVPTLVLPDGTTMFESAAICLHLTNLYSGLSPAITTAAHAKYLQWMVFLSANLYEALLRVYYSDRYSAAGEAHAEDVKARAMLQITQHLYLLEANLSPYLTGEVVSAADLYLFMLLDWLPQEAHTRFSKITQLVTEIAKLPAVKTVMAQNR
jgi:glutathione S-transferase